jgi:hypothetical protein
MSLLSVALVVTFAFACVALGFWLLNTIRNRRLLFVGSLISIPTAYGLLLLVLSFAPQAWSLSFNVFLVWSVAAVLFALGAATEVYTRPADVPSDIAVPAGGTDKARRIAARTLLPGMACAYLGLCVMCAGAGSDPGFEPTWRNMAIPIFITAIGSSLTFAATIAYLKTFR